MKKVVAILLCMALLASAFAVQTAALTEEEAYAGYYLVGTMTDWVIDRNYRLGLNPKNADEYLISDVEMTASDAFKVVYSHNGKESTAGILSVRTITVPLNERISTRKG